MWRYISCFLLVTSIVSVQAESRLTDDGAQDDRTGGNWTLEQSDNMFWIKTVNDKHHELLFPYPESKLQFILILKKHSSATDNLSLDTRLSAFVTIDRSKRQRVAARVIDDLSEDLVIQLDLDMEENNTYLAQMINGLTIVIDLKFLTGNKTTLSERVSFSLKGFTIALNDLMIVDEVGSLDPDWLVRNNKDHALYCLLTTEISIEAMLYRLDGKDYNNTLQLIPETGYSIIDHNLSGIIQQVYDIPREDMGYVPRAEKYRMFSNCMAQVY